MALNERHSIISIEQAVRAHASERFRQRLFQQQRQPIRALQKLSTRALGIPRKLGHDAPTSADPFYR
jgi:hypothetical protein